MVKVGYAIENKENTLVMIEPVLNEKGEPCWLTMRHGKMSSFNGNKPIKEVIMENKSLEEVKIFELKPQGLWECRKCGATIQSIPNPPIECYKSQGGCDRTSQFNVFTKIINPDLWKLPKWNDLPELNMKESYENATSLIRNCLIFVEDIQYKLFTLWNISQYKIENWESVGWLIFLGLPDSGKTKALDLIRELGWRIVDTGSGVTFPAVVRAAHYHSAGILFDEAHDKFTRKTEAGQNLITFVKPSYRRGSKYVVADKEDQEKIISYNNFGFKAFASERPLEHAMMTRCISFEMEEDYPEIQKLTTVQNKLNDLQTQFLHYRYKTGNPPELPEPFTLKGRVLEIYESIIRTGLHIGVDVSDVIEHAKQQKEEQIEDFRNSTEWEVLNAIKGGEENEKLIDAPEHIRIKEIVIRMGWEVDNKTTQQVGYILAKKFGLKTKRKTEGTVLLLNDPKNARKLKYFYRRFRV